MFNQTVRTITAVVIALAVVLSFGAGTAMAAQDDGLLGGDDTDDGIDIGDDSGVSVGTDGVGVGGDEGVNASTDSVSVAGQEVGSETVSDGGDPPSLDGDSGPIATDGTNVEVGGDSGVSVGTDGVSAGGDSGVSAGPDGVSVIGEDAGSGQLPSADGLPGTDELPGGNAAPGGGSGDVPTGPVPLDIRYSVSELNDGVLRIESTRASPGPQVEMTLATGQRRAGEQTLLTRLEASDGDRTYLDFEGEGTGADGGLENVDGALYTVNESGGIYILALSRDRVQTAGIGEARGEKIGVANVKNTPGTQRGIVAGGLFPAAIAGLGPSAPVGPEAPEQLGGGVSCDGERCLTGTSGINETIPDNRATESIKGSYPFPRTTDTSGTVLPCSKPVSPDDLPADQLPGLSDLPDTGAGLPTSLLTNDAVLGLALGVAPAPCDVSDPLADPVANPAVEPGSGVSPTFDPGHGSVDTDDGAHVVRHLEFGPGGNLGTTDGVSAVLLTEEHQAGLVELDASNSEYDYVLVNTRGERERNTATGTVGTSIRDDYAGLGGDLENELGTGNGEAGLRVSVIGKSAGVSIACTPSGCQPDYEGLPKLGDLPTFPNPAAGDTGLPA